MTGTSRAASACVWKPQFPWLVGKHVSVQAFREKVQLGVDDPLRVLFAQIKGQAIRPTIEGQAIRPQLPSPGKG